MNDDNRFTYDTYSQVDNSDITPIGQEKEEEKDKLLYPEVKCKEAHFSFFSIAFPLLFAVFFGLGGIVFPIILILHGVFKGFNKDDYGFLFSFIPFSFVSIGAFYVLFKRIHIHNEIKRNGQELYGFVYAYEKDHTMYINGNPTNKVLIKIPTPEGDRTIKYQLESIKKPYQINQQLRILKYEDYYLILK